MTKGTTLFTCITLAVGFLVSTNGFAPSQSVPTHNKLTQDYVKAFGKSDDGLSWPLNMAVVPPSETATVGVVGRGYISILVAKLAALAGYQTWIVCPPGDDEKVLSLIDSSGIAPDNLKIISGADTDLVDSRMRETDALLVAVDDDTTMSVPVLKYLISPEVALKLKRVVAMSRNLNGEGMGFFVKASKVSANKGVWDCSTADAYKAFEEVVKEQTAACDAEYTFARAGTLKGGACGGGEDNEFEFKQYLSEEYYTLVKKDVVNWQLIFDCQVRGVKLAKGDVLPGPGAKAVFTATGVDEALGDTSRCGLAEAMVRSLAIESCGNIDFGVGTVGNRDPPTDAEWQKLFESL